MALTLDTHSFIGSPELGMSASPVGGSSRKAGGVARLYKSSHNRRKNSSAGSSVGSFTTSPVSTTAFPSFDPHYEYSQTYVVSNPPTDPLPLFTRRSEDQSSLPFSRKIKPLVRHSSSKDKEQRAPINLNMTKAENEERGAYVSDIPRDSMVGSRNAFTGHSRTISGNSQASHTSTHSSLHHRSTTYIHPARQIPHSETPPVPNSQLFVVPPPLEAENSAEDDERPNSSHSNVAQIPDLPSPGYRRSNGSGGGGAISGGILRSNTSTPTCSTCPPLPSTNMASATILSTSVPATSRSSIDSSFRDRIAAGLSSRHRSRTNSNAPMDPDEEARTVAALRAEFNAREAAKDEKYRRREEKRDRRRSEAEERKARRRRGNSGATAGSTGSGFAASLSGTSELTPVVTNTAAGSTSSPKKARSISSKKRSDSEKGASRHNLEQLEGIRYDTTVRDRRPTTGAFSTGVPDEEGGDEAEIFNEKRRDGIPKRGKKQGLGSAGKATQSLWMTFWFKFRTALMKMMAKKR